MPSDLQQLQCGFAMLATNGTDSRVIADKAAATWCDIDAALSPIIGQRGVAALFRRSLHLTRPAHACLVSVPGGADQAGDFTALRNALSQNSPSDAAAANSALLQTFVDLLAHLIGESLTEHLLRSVWETHSSSGAVREI